MVPQLTDLREEILREFHYSQFVVHPLGETPMTGFSHLALQV